MTERKDSENVKALMLHVAVDKALDRTKKSRDKYVDGGFYGPFSRKDIFEYIPIPESQMQKHKRKLGAYFPARYLRALRGEHTYGNTFGERQGKRLLNDIPEKLRNKLENVPVHHDPDFRFSTYGEGKEKTPRGKQCAQLQHGDLLVFCASLQNEKNEKDRGQFVIGYFTIEEVYDFTLDDDEFERRYRHTRSYVIDRYKDKNAHFSDAFARSYGWKKRGEISAKAALVDDYKKRKEKDFVLVVGKKGGSCLMNKAIRLTEEDGGFYVPRELVKDLGLKKPPGRLMFHMGFKRINWEHDNEQALKKLRSMLDNGGCFHGR